MAIVDSKGRLFGKINLIDLVVVLAVVALAGRFGYKHFAPKAPVGGGLPALEVEMKLAQVTQPTIDAMPKGTKVWESKTNTYLGTIVATRYEPAKVVTQTGDGRLMEDVSKTTYDLYVLVSGPGNDAGDNGYFMGGIEMKIGNPTYLRSPLWKGTAYPVKIDPTPKPRS